MKTAIVLFAFSVLLFGCKQQPDGANSSQPVTQTIAPADAKPAPSSGSDTLTQTVDLGDGRSEAEGGSTVTTPPADSAKKQAPAKKKHK